MKKHKFFDPALWVLIGINIYLVYHYYQHPEVFTTLIWLYWAQSVTLGLFNFLDMLTVRTILKPDPSQPNSGSPMGRSSAFFFLFHYGFFHVAYLIFIAIMKRSGPFDWGLFKYFLVAFVAGQIITFVQHKIQQRTTPTDMGRMFFTPYIRIVPMHLTILVPAFLHVSNMGVFLILKAIADVLMYTATRPPGRSKELDTAMLASQQSMNM
jgi:Family of unknown function (DUF6498)